MQRITVLVAIACACALGCKKERAKQSPPPAPEPVVDESIFLIAHPQVVPMQLPGRFTAPLPTSVRDLETRSYPPRPFVRAALEAGTFDMRKRLVDAISRAAAAGPIPEDLESWYVSEFGYVPSADTCKWLVDAATKTQAAPARAVLWKAAARCSDPALAPAITRDDVPDDVIIEFYFNAHDGSFPYSDRVARAAANVARTAKNEFDVRQLGFVFARMKGDQSIAAITALQKTIADSHRRALAGLGMLRSDSAAGRAIGERACKHPEVKSDPMCKPDDPSLVPAPHTDLAGMIDAGEDAKTLLAKFPRPDVIAALTACTHTGKDYRRTMCFENLAEVDRPAALGLAKELAASDDKRLAKIASSLLLYPDAAAAEKKLVQLGFILDKQPDPDPEDTRPPPLSIEDVLVERGRSNWFDAETGMFPNEHDALLADLAALAAPVLDKVVFEEVPPPESEMDTGRYRLLAYANGKRYALDAENRGDWYDVEAVIGFVNALLVAHKSDIRLVALPTGDQTVKVIAGPAKAIHALVDAKLIDLGDAKESERVGKAFEDKVFNDLQDGGTEVYRNVPLSAP